MRLLINNYITDKANLVTTYIPNHVRVFLLQTIDTPVSGIATGIITGATGTIIFSSPFMTNVVDNTGLVITGKWVDIQYTAGTVPYQINPNPESIVINGATYALSLPISIIDINGAIITNHQSYPYSNSQSANRNDIIPSISYVGSTARVFKSIGINCSLPTDKNVRCISLVNHNLTNTANIIIKCYNSAGLLLYNTTITNPNRIVTNAASLRAANNNGAYAQNTDTNNIFIHYIPTLIQVSSITIDISDTANTDTFISIGSVYVGDYWESSNNTYYGWSTSIIDTSTTTYALSPFSVRRKPYHGITVNIKNILSTEADNWKYIYEQVGTFTDIILDLFPLSTDPNDLSECYYCRFATNNLMITNDTFQRYSGQLTFRESL